MANIAVSLAKEFCNLYYSEMSLNGFERIVNIFEHNAVCNYNGIEIDGGRKILWLLSNAGIKRVVYYQLTCTCQAMGDAILIQVRGGCQGVSLLNDITEIQKFVEIFVLRMGNDWQYRVSNYMITIL
jgi:hypothetical protein